MRKYLDIPLTIAVTLTLTVRDALATGGPTPGARGQRQARALRSLRRAGLPAGPQG